MRRRFSSSPELDIHPTPLHNTTTAPTNLHSERHAVLKISWTAPRDSSSSTVMASHVRSGDGHALSSESTIISRELSRLHAWDGGVFENELISSGVIPRRLKVPASDSRSIDLNVPAGAEEVRPMRTGTFKGSQKAVTEIYRRSEERSILSTSDEEA